MSRHALIDADVIVYWSASAGQKTKYHTAVGVFDNNKAYEDHLKELPTYQLALKETEGKGKRDAMIAAKAALPAEKVIDYLDERIVLNIANKNIFDVCNAVKASSHTLFVSGDSNFRERIASIQPYKGNRVQEKPHYYDLVKQHILGLRETVVSVDQEADDDIGIAASSFNGECCICTIDKDLMQIPGNHYNWNKQITFRVSPDKGDLWFWLQMLQGDTADNIPGIKDIGEVRAKAELEDRLSRSARAQAVAALYRQQYGEGWKDAINEVGRLLWIRREADQVWDFDKYTSEEFS